MEEFKYLGVLFTNDIKMEQGLIVINEGVAPVGYGIEKAKS